MAGHGAPSPERVPYAADGCRGASRALRHSHPQGRHLGGHPGLGDQRGDHPLHPGLCGRATPIPHDGNNEDPKAYFARFGFRSIVATTAF